jgi:hypothetical protein
MLFIAGKWRTPEGVERRHEQQKVWNENYRATIHGHTTTLLSYLRQRIRAGEAQIASDARKLEVLEELTPEIEARFMNSIRDQRTSS